MPITYVRYVHRKPDPDPIAATFEDLEEDSILLFDPVLEATSIGVGDLYRRLDAGLRANTIVIFRGADANLINALERDHLLKSNLETKHVMALGPRPK